MGKVCPRTRELRKETMEHNYITLYDGVDVYGEHKRDEFVEDIEKWADQMQDKGYEVIATYAQGDPYGWDFRIVYKDKEELCCIMTEGCSCNSMGEFNLDDLLANPYILTLSELETEVENLSKWTNRENSFATQILKVFKA